MTKSFRLLVVALIAMPLAANAYVDPGTGMLVWQGLLAAFGAALVFFRDPRAALRRLIGRFKRK